MENKADKPIESQVRKVYEPRYGRHLSDEEVYEIRTNLRTLAEGIVSIAERLYGKPEGVTDSISEKQKAQAVEPS